MRRLYLKLLSLFIKTHPTAVSEPPDKPAIASQPVLNKYFKHNITGDYIFIHSSISGDCFEFINNRTMFSLDALGLEQLIDQLIKDPITTDYEVYKYYPRTCMHTLHRHEIEDNYEHVHPGADPIYQMFSVSVHQCLNRIKSLKKQALEEIKNRPRVPIDKNLITVTAVKDLDKDEEDQLNFNRFDKIN